jgi:NAD(P)-dependent dehydrogenase (short-subunit alcohol dehydrogenase family)
MLLQGKTAVVAGAGPGLGRDVALLFAEHGADLVLGARRTDRVEAVAAEVRQRGGSAEVVELDICDTGACERAVSLAVDRYGGLDILVNNAFDTGDFQRFEDADLATWRRTMDVNLWGTLQMTRAAVPALRGPSDRRSVGGCVVMVNTMSSWRYEERFGAYTISKAALESATKMLAVELGGDGIRVNGVHPGYIWGDSVKLYFEYLAAERGVSPDDVYDEVVGRNCLKNIPTSAEIAGSVLFLASDLAAPVTGQSLGVNAGQGLR